jgi:FkbM family methyltransferase
MKLIYLTTKTYPANSADHIYVRELAKSFSYFGVDFLFVVGKIGNDLSDINTTSINIRRHKLLSFIKWFFCFVRKNETKECVFISNDFYILSIVIFLRFLFGFDYKVCCDCHMLTDTFKDIFVLKRCDIIITTSKQLRSFIINKFSELEFKIFVAYGGIDPAFFRGLEQKSKVKYRKELNLPTENILVGYVGGFKSLGQEKGIKTMIEGLSFLPNNYICVFVGGLKDEIDEYIKFASDCDVLNRCIFPPREKYELIPKYEFVMDILVIPYPQTPHFENYGFPMKVYEYLASGVPIVYSNLNIINEILLNRGTSFLSENPLSFADSVMKALEKKYEPIIFSWHEKSKEIISILRNITIKNRKKEYLEIIDSLLLKIDFLNFHYPKKSLFSFLKKVYFYNIKYIYYIFLLKLRFRENILVKTFFGKEFVLPVNDALTPPIFFNNILGGPEFKLIKYFIKNIKDESVFYDIGSNYGFYSALVAKFIEQGEIHAFEPNKRAFNILVNFLHENNFIANELAIANYNGYIDFYDAGVSGRSGGSTTLTSVFNKKEKNYEKIKVNACKLDDYILKAKKPDFIKIDVEGGEENVLLGGTKFLIENNPVISMEIFNDSYEIKNYYHRACSTLISFGYKPFMINYYGDLIPLNHSKIFETSDLKKYGFDNFIFKK